MAGQLYPTRPVPARSVSLLQLHILALLLIRRLWVHLMKRRCLVLSSIVPPALHPLPDLQTRMGWQD